MDVISLAYDDASSGTGQGQGRKAILGRQAKPDEEAKKALDKKMVKMARTRANDISKEVQSSLDVKYNADTKKRLKREFEKAEMEKRRKLRDTKVNKKRQGMASRAERKSVQDASQLAEKEKYDRMSIEEKAALKRKARKTAQKKTGGMSEFLDASIVDAEDIAQQAVKVKMTSNNLNTYKNSHTGIAKSMAGRMPSLTPLSRAIIDYKGENFLLPDDMTLLANDDFRVNDMVRNTAVPSMELHTQGAKYFTKEGKKKGARFQGDTGHDEARMPRNTMLDRFKRAIR